jgi:regulator of sigma E protease
MVDESMDKEQLSKPPQAWEFAATSWQRLIIMLAVYHEHLYCFYHLCFYPDDLGRPKVPSASMKYGVSGSIVPSIKYGLRNGDKILSVDE